jgi:hypothetical protein
LSILLHELRFQAGGALTKLVVDDLKIDFQLKIVNATIQVAGISMQFSSYSTKEFKVNWNRRWWLPIDFKIPLGLNSGLPVPFSVTFNQMFQVNTGFNARNPVLDAYGEYGYKGGLWAGYKGGNWTVTAALDPYAKSDIGKNLDGISIGINSLAMSSAVRIMVGIGTFGFNTGVYGGLRFGGTVLRQWDVALACRQGTVEAWLDAGGRLFATRLRGRCDQCRNRPFHSLQARACRLDPRSPVEGPLPWHHPGAGRQRVAEPAGAGK